MNFKAIATYSAVRFNNKNETWLDAARIPGLVLTQLEHGLVNVKSPNDNIIVSWTNISFAVPADTAVVAKEPKQPENDGTKPMREPKK